jgi:uncharacterized repeat protein (TIGR01451 family)
MSVSNPHRKSLTCGLVVALATLVSLSVASAQQNPRSHDQIRERQNYEVIVGDFYTGRSPYFKSGGEPAPVVAQAKPAPAPAPAPNCSVINSGLVHMTKTMPAETSLGQPFTYELKPMAVGCAGNVAVTDQIPEGASLVATEPQASVSGNTLVWNLGNMDAGESRTLKVTVKPEREGALASCATVKADPRVCAKTVVGKPRLAIDKTGPEVAQLGSDVAYNIVVKNVGTAVAKNVVVADKVPAGLGGVREIPTTVGDLAPGASKTIPVTLKAAERGRHCNVAVATASNTASVENDACTLVVKPGLKLEKSGAAEQLVNKQVTYTVKASNTGDTDLTGVVVTDTAPAQTRIVSAQGAAVAGNTAKWSIGTLKAGESKTFEVVVTSAQMGRWCNAASISTKEGLRENAEACTVWKGVPGVLLEVVDNPDPIPIGETTTYTIRVTNQGNADLTNLATAYESDDETVPVSSAQGTVSGKKVTFPTVPVLKSKQSFTYTIVVKGTAAGDARQKVTLTGSSLKLPVVEEESTTVY